LTDTGTVSVVKLEHCWASGAVNAQVKGAAAIGGLIGEIYDQNADAESQIIWCYATGDVSAVSNNPNSSGSGGAFAVGGLAGLVLGSDVSESWAGGAVHALRTTAGPVTAGGLVGYLGGYTGNNNERSSISDCYALGNVLAGKSHTGTGLVAAGGLVGAARNQTSRTIKRSFAAGSVIAQSASASTSVDAGGVIGRKEQGGALSDTAALGAKIAVTGGSARSAGRVYGYNAGAAAANNYALNSILTGDNASYDVYVPGAVVSSSDATAKDGKDAGIGEVRLRTFWETTLGFTAAAWDFGGVVGRGYPKLAWQ
jgi:hypothetical protein